MMLIILTILPIISIGVDSITPDDDYNPKHAVSSQNFHRDDVPLSYKYSSVHIYTTQRPEQRHSYNQKENINYDTRQYAPLNQNTYQNDYHKINSEDDETSLSSIAEQYGQLNEYSTEINEKNYHLEPRVDAENLEDHNENTRSYVPGHNIEVLQSNRANLNHDLYRAFYKKFHNQKAEIPSKLAIYKKPVTQSDHFKSGEIPVSREHDILYTFLPRHISDKHNEYEINAPLKQSQALTAKLPRLHLNIARVYGFTHLHRHTPTDVKLHNPKPSHTQAIFVNEPNHEKTILYPVQDINKNYPIYPSFP